MLKVDSFFFFFFFQIELGNRALARQMRPNKGVADNSTGGVGGILGRIFHVLNVK